MFAVALTAVALTASSPIPVTGGTSAERALVRGSLADVDPGVVTSARIDGRHYLVLGPPAFRTPGVRGDRAQWEAQALVASVTARFALRGDRLDGYEVTGNCGSGASCASGGSAAQESAGMGPPGARRLRAVVLSNARAAGLAVRSARVLRIGGGVLDVVVRLREDQLLDRRAQAALMTLFGPPTMKPVALHFLSVEAPDGTAVAYGGSVVNGGSWSFGGDTGRMPVPRAFPSRLSHARTDIVVQLTRAFGLVRRRTYRFICGDGVQHLGDCPHLLADRWALLVPAPGWECAGPVGGWTVTVHGIFAGQAVSRSYDGCYGGTVNRWARFLGV